MRHTQTFGWVAWATELFLLENVTSANYQCERESVYKQKNVDTTLSALYATQSNPHAIPCSNINYHGSGARWN